jgi:hypothetical protein
MNLPNNASCESKFSHFEQSEKSHKVYQKGFFLRKKQKINQM